MFSVSEAEATAIRDAFHQRGELSAPIELRRMFPGIFDNRQARECVRIIAGWPLRPVRPPAQAAGTRTLVPLPVQSGGDVTSASSTSKRPGKEEHRTAAAVMASAGQDGAQRLVTPRRVRLVDHAIFAAAVALDPQEPRREGAERLVEGLGRRGQWISAVAVPVALRRVHGCAPYARLTIEGQRAVTPAA